MNYTDGGKFVKRFFLLIPSPSPFHGEGKLYSSFASSLLFYRREARSEVVDEAAKEKPPDFSEGFLLRT